MTENRDTAHNPPAPATAPQPGRPASPLLILERTAGIQLHNRFIWLVAALALYLIGQLSYIQWQTGTQQANPRFDTLDLMAILLVVIEGALLLTAVLLALSTIQVRAAWYRRYPGQRFSYIAAGLGGVLILILLQVILLVPVLILHRYPELQAEGIRIPLMVLQRSMLAGCAVSLGYNLILLLRHVIRLPWWLAAIGGLAAEIGCGYFITWFSCTNSAYMRLNDVFFYNQLWRYIDGFPRLDSRNLFHNIEMPYFAYYLAAGIITVLIVLLLWLPRASTLSIREKPPQTSS